jgi:hypothetical protein
MFTDELGLDQTPKPDHETLPFALTVAFSPSVANKADGQHLPSFFLSGLPSAFRQ